jgi:hypothetical protein
MIISMGARWVISAWILVFCLFVCLFNYSS